MPVGPVLKILVIDENRIRAAIIEAGLHEAGHRAVALVQKPKRRVRF